MLTAKQFEALGRLTLAFNEIEYTFEIYIAHLLGAPEWGISELLAEEGQFHNKAERFDGILRALGKEHPVFDYQIEAARKWVKQAKVLAHRRNEYAHAVAVHDFVKNETRLRIKRAEIACDANEINGLAVEAALLVEQLHSHCGDLLVLIGTARESSRPGSTSNATETDDPECNV